MGVGKRKAEKEDVSCSDAVNCWHVVKSCKWEGSLVQWWWLRVKERLQCGLISHQTLYKLWPALRGIRWILPTFVSASSFCQLHRNLAGGFNVMKAETAELNNVLANRPHILSWQIQGFCVKEAERSSPLVESLKCFCFKNEQTQRTPTREKGNFSKFRLGKYSNMLSTSVLTACLPHSQDSQSPHACKMEAVWHEQLQDGGVRWDFLEKSFESGGSAQYD